VTVVAIILPGLMIKQRWTTLRLQAKWYSNSFNCALCWLKQLISLKLNSLLYFASYMLLHWANCWTGPVSSWLKSPIMGKTVKLQWLCNRMMNCWRDDESSMVQWIFANRVITAWNNLPTSVSFTSLPAFSRTIRSVDFRIFLKCNSC